MKNVCHILKRMTGGLKLYENVVCIKYGVQWSIMSEKHMVYVGADQQVLTKSTQTRQTKFKNK